MGIEKIVTGLGLGVLSLDLLKKIHFRSHEWGWKKKWEEKNRGSPMHGGSSRLNSLNPKFHTVSIVPSALLLSSAKH